MDEMNTVKFLERYCFWIALNMNDTFDWGTADYEQVDIEDLPKLMEIEGKFGPDGVDAFVACLRGVDVMDHPGLRTAEYAAAKEALVGYKFSTGTGSGGFFHGHNPKGNQKKWWEIWK